MRVDLGQAVRVKPGEVILIRARLPKSMRKQDQNARLTVWSCTPGYDYSPHIQLAAMGLVHDGKPEMVPPMRITLTPHAPIREISFVSDELLNFKVRQEVDRADDLCAAVKVKRYNMRVYRFIQRIRTFVRAFRAKGFVHQ